MFDPYSYSSASSSARNPSRRTDDYDDYDDDGARKSQKFSSRSTKATGERRNSSSGFSFTDSTSRPNRRSSIGESFSSPAASTAFPSPAATAAASPQKGFLDFPCRPATLAMLYRFRNKKTGIVKLHGSNENSPISLVGWIYKQTASVGSGESEFEFCDNTGKALVRLGIPTEREEWFLPNIRRLVLGDRGKCEEKEEKIKEEKEAKVKKEEKEAKVKKEEKEEKMKSDRRLRQHPQQPKKEEGDAGDKENSTSLLNGDAATAAETKTATATKTAAAGPAGAEGAAGAAGAEVPSYPSYQYVKLAGTVTQDLENDLIVVRALHIRAAEAAEIAYFHTIECVMCKFDLNPTVAAAAAASTTAALPSITAEELMEVEISDKLEWKTRDEDQMLLLQYITKYRIGEIGVELEQMKEALKHLINSSRFEAAVAKLEAEEQIVVVRESNIVDLVI